MATEWLYPNGNGATQNWTSNSYTWIDECTGGTTGCTETATWASPPDQYQYSTPYAIQNDSASGASDETQHTYTNTSYANVDEVTIYIKTSNYGGGNNHRIDVNTNLSGTAQTEIYNASTDSPGWHSHTYTGSWTQANINSLVVSLIDSSQNWCQISVATVVVEVQEEVVAGAGAPTAALYGPLVGSLGGPI